MFIANAATTDVGYTALMIVGILAGALITKELMIRCKLSPVLGEIIWGVALGNWFFPSIRNDVFIKMFAEIGILVLMFQLGLEASIREMLRVGMRAFCVALGGATASIVLGAYTIHLLFPTQHFYSCIFFGITIAATSVGISARVLKELGANTSPTGCTILGAAIIDDILGLVALAVINGLIVGMQSGEAISTNSTLFIGLKAILFLVISLAVGIKLSPRMFGLATRMQNNKLLLTVGFSFCLLLSWLSTLAGLAAMIGAYAAGLVVEDVHYKDITDREAHTLEDVIEPLGEFFIPIFFVMVGAMVDVRIFTNPHTLLLSILVIGVAIFGKIFCGLGTWGDTSVNKLAVVVGMIPRGEVVIIVAAKGRELTLGGTPVVSEALYSAIIVMVIATTLITPAALQRTLKLR